MAAADSEHPAGRQRSSKSCVSFGLCISQPPRSAENILARGQLAGWRSRQFRLVSGSVTLLSWRVLVGPSRRFYFKNNNSDPQNPDRSAAVLLPSAPISRARTRFSLSFRSTHCHSRSQQHKSCQIANYNIAGRHSAEQRTHGIINHIWRS